MVVLLKLLIAFMVIFAFPEKTLIVFLKLPFLSKDAVSLFIKTAELESVFPITVIVCDEITELSFGKETVSGGLKRADLY